MSKLGLEPAPRPARPTAPGLGSEERASAVLSLQPGHPVPLDPTSQGQQPLCSSTLFSQHFLNTCSVPGAVPGAGGACPPEDVHLPPLHKKTMLNEQSRENARRALKVLVLHVHRTGSPEYLEKASLNLSKEQGSSASKGAEGERAQAHPQGWPRGVREAAPLRSAPAP